MSKAKKLITLALVGACGFGVWKAGGAVLGDSEVEGTQRLINQVWIERMPEDQRDMVGHLVLVDHPRGKVGIVGRSSTWRHLNEIFLWQLRGSELGTKFPQDRVKGKAQVRTWRCEGEAPAPFELCLEVSHGGRSVVLYSREDWVVKPHDHASFDLLAEEEPRLTSVLAELQVETAAAEGDFESVDAGETWPESVMPLLD
jgi:hypothetical protein